MRKLIFFNITLVLFISTSLLVQVSSASASDPDDIYWDVSISTPANGLNGEVFALTVYDNKLIVGGEFTLAGEDTVNYVAAWDGSTWSALGTGMNGRVQALTVYDGQLVAGGRFNTAGGVTAELIASWDGSTWSALGTGIDLDTSVWITSFADLTVYENKLIAAVGYTIGFEHVGGIIASWDGSSWSDLGMEEFHLPTNLTVYDNNLIVTGIIQYGVAYFFSASWNGSSWSSMGYIGWVYDLTVYGGQLIAGGDFTSGIAYWDGASWLLFELGIPTYGNSIRAFDVYANKLIAGGSFDSIGGIAANRIAAWNGLSWSALGSGTNSSPLAFTVYDNSLIVGGSFNSAGSKDCRYLARWTKTPCCAGSRGDVNYDGDDANVLDLTFLVDYIFRGSGDSGPCNEESDVNGDDNSADILDLTYLVDAIFRGGPVPPGC